MAEQKTPPRAFLCHSSGDKELATRLASDLVENGIQVWFDAWEIEPGQSLRMRIDEGIDKADYFIVLLTKNSLASKWVQTELDAAMIKRINGHCRLIPVLHNVSMENVPPTLSGLRCVAFSDYDHALRELVNVCHDIFSAKPALGAAPPRAQSASSRQSYLSPVAEMVAKKLCEDSEHAHESIDPRLSPQDLRSALGLTNDELELAADELQQFGLITIEQVKTGRDEPFTSIFPNPLLFSEFDPLVKGWSPSKDAHDLAKAMVNSKEQILSLPKMAELLRWDTRRSNPAAYYLFSRGLVEVSKTRLYPWAYANLVVTAGTRRFALQEPPSGARPRGGYGESRG